MFYILTAVFRRPWTTQKIVDGINRVINLAPPKRSGPGDPLRKHITSGLPTHFQENGQIPIFFLEGNQDQIEGSIRDISPGWTDPGALELSIIIDNDAIGAAFQDLLRWLSGVEGFVYGAYIEAIPHENRMVRSACDEFTDRADFNPKRLSWRGLPHLATITYYGEELL